jgi:hypothetical protein
VNFGKGNGIAHPILLAHWQVARATLKPKLDKELTNASPVTAFNGGLEFAHPQKTK